MKKSVGLASEYGNEFYHSEFSSAEKATPELTVCNATYKIGESVITMTYELDLETHTDTYGRKSCRGRAGFTAVPKRRNASCGKIHPCGRRHGKFWRARTAAESADGSQPEQNAAANPSAVSSAPDNGAASRSAENPSFDWKTVYTDYIRSLGDSWQYTLIYLDGDGHTRAICFKAQAKQTVPKSARFTAERCASRELGAFGNCYIQKSGLILTAGGHMGSYYDTVYCLPKRRFYQKIRRCVRRSTTTRFILTKAIINIKSAGQRCPKANMTVKKTRFSTIITQQASTRRL